MLINIINDFVTSAVGSVEYWTCKSFEVHVRLLLAIFLARLQFVMINRVFAGIICLMRQIMVIGLRPVDPWMPASKHITVSTNQNGAGIRV
jgi:hypothetical protein